MSDRVLAGSRLHFCEGSLAKPFMNRRGRVAARAGLVLELWDHDGHHGVGEAAPLPGHSPDSLDDCRAALDGIAERITALDDDGWPLTPWLAAVPAARFAWESAWCDLAARRQGRSVAGLLGGGPATTPIALNAVVDSLDAAGLALARGITTLKVKVGGSDAAAELALLGALRERFADRFTLRLDANGAFSLAEAPTRLAAYQALRPAFVEQPTAELARLGRCPVPWAADESLIAATPEALEQLLAAEGCAAWVIKPAALGLRGGRQLALRALARGLGVVITHLLDGPIGLAAACELALSLPRPPWACGLDRHPGLAAWPAVELPHHRHFPSALHPSGRPGLGFDREGLPWS